MKMNQRTRSLHPIVLCAAILGGGGCGDEGESTTAAVPRGPSGEVVDLPGPTFYPEGVAFDAAGRMYVSSILTGALVRVDSGSATPVEWAAAGVLGQSLVAIETSAADDVLWACLGTFGTDFAPALLGVSLTTGTEVVRHTFPPQADGSTAGLCNEIAEDADGNVYVSDSFGARILRVAAAQRTTPDSAAIWAAGPELAAQAFGVNGIAYDGAGALLAVNTETGALLRVGLADAAIGEVELERPLALPDGLRMASAGTAIVVEQGAGRLAAIDLASGALTGLGGGLRSPTSLDLIDGRAWVAEGQLTHIFDGTSPELPFQVHRVLLP
jgi:sugar lactone lactonase YvrE